MHAYTGDEASLFFNLLQDKTPGKKNVLALILFLKSLLRSGGQGYGQ